MTVNYDINSNTASNGSDYARTFGTLTFAPGQVSKTVSIPIINDATAEVTKNFNLQLYSPSANATIADAFARATIIDNDATTGTPAASIIDAAVDETDKTATVTVVLDKPSASWTSLDIAGQNITAVGSDYRALQIGKIAFAPGETEKQLLLAY